MRRLRSVLVWLVCCLAFAAPIPAAEAQAAGADVVGVQEPGSNLERLARDLGWNHVDAPQQISTTSTSWRAG